MKVETVQNHEIVITGRKIWDNVKRFWWIFLLVLLLGLLAIVKDIKDGSNIAKQTYNVKTMLYVQPNGSEEEGNNEIANAIDRYTNAYEDAYHDSGIVYVIDMLNSLADSKDIQEILNQRLVREGYEGFNKANDKLLFTKESRLIVCSLEQEDLERSVFLINNYSQLLTEQFNEIISNKKASLVKEANVEEYDETQSLTSASQIFSVRHIFMLCLFMGLGALIILFLTMFDKRVRSFAEISAICPMDYLGKISKDKRQEITCLKVKIAIQDKINKDKLEDCILLTVRGRKISNDLIIKLTEGLMLSNEAPVSYGLNFEDNIELPEIVQKVKNVVLLISVNDDTIKDIENSLTNLCAMDKKVIGCIMIE